MSIWIPGNVPSSKNSRIYNAAMKRSFASKATRKWLKESEVHWLKNRYEFLSMLQEVDPPYLVKFTFVRGTQHKFDYVNPLQTVQDAMVKFRWIEDDNCTLIRPIFGEYQYDKEKPGVWIRILNGEK